MQKINPFLWFDNNAEAAVQFHTSLIKRSKILAVSHYSPEAAGTHPTARRDRS